MPLGELAPLVPPAALSGLDVEPVRRLSHVMWRHDLVRAQVESGWRQAPDRYRERYAYAETVAEAAPPSE